jgi:hypothetical protein
MRDRTPEFTRGSICWLGWHGLAQADVYRAAERCCGARMVECAFDAIGVLETKPRVPVGTARAKAAWLRSWLDSGVCVGEVGAVLGVPPDDIEALAAGRTTLANTSWAKIAEFVASKVH